MRGPAAVLLALLVSCAQPSTSASIRITGSDTMINLLQAWAEHYAAVRPGASVQVSGGGSGVGLAGLIDGTLDIAAASREIRPDERRRATARYGTSPREFVVALDAIAVYVHRDNPLHAIAMDDLAEIYGERGQLTRWAQLGASHAGCRSDTIIRVGRQNNSGTYAFFREVVLGSRRDFALGSIDQSGSKDVVALVSTTPCAIGYSGIAFASSGVRTLELVPCGVPGARPTKLALTSGAYPLGRRLYFYTAAEPTGAARAFIDWVLAEDGQRVADALGFVRVAQS